MCIRDSYETGAPWTAHTTNPVPFILVNADPKYTLRENGCLAAVSYTHLDVYKRQVWYWASVISSFMEKDISGIRSADVHSAFLRSLLSGKSCTDRNSV